MFNIDRRYNITMEAGDNGILDLSLCGCDQFEEGDYVVFRYPEGEVRVDEFEYGIAKIMIPDSYYAVDGSYCIFVGKKDGRKAQVFSGKFIRKGGC